MIVALSLSAFAGCVYYFPVLVGRKILGAVVGNDRKVHEMYTVSYSNFYCLSCIKKLALFGSICLLAAFTGHYNRIALGAHGATDFVQATTEKVENWSQNCVCILSSGRWYCTFIRTTI